jgi:hypothetical protein
MKPGPAKLSPAAKVAAGATAVIAVLYVIGVIVFNVLFASHQTAQSDYYLGTRLTAAACGWSTRPGRSPRTARARPGCRPACLPRTRRTTGSPSPPTSAGRARSGSS